ncbi:MAG TPA: rhodanese-like domain-containing protein [Gammaproteobacteria bacterium]|nr:rhodanese-like domain-containing protein [Gammaproteobacteria bacterium]
MYPVREIEVADLQKMIEDEHLVQLVDVRNPTEVARGAIPGSSNVPLHLIPLHMTQLPQSGPVVLYCHSGARSAQACAFLNQQGVENVYNLRGGIQAWISSGLQVA